MNDTSGKKHLGFWSSWSLTVGIMIGSGIFLLPSVLVPFGMMGFWGWAVTASGSLCLGLTIAWLAMRNPQSGGVFVYSRAAFGDFPAYLVAWGYWNSYWIALSAIAIAFAGYVGFFIPAVEASPALQTTVALALIWILTGLNMIGLKQASAVQIALTLAKIVPLIAVIALGLLYGSSSNLPDSNPGKMDVVSLISATALLTLWAFAGLEAGGVAAEDTVEPEKTIPRAVVSGTLTVAAIYVAACLAVMRLVPAVDLASSSAPFADAVAPWDAAAQSVVAAGALVAIAGALNGTIFVAGQIPMAVAKAELAPWWLGKQNSDGSPSNALVLSAVLASALLIANSTEGAVALFEYLIVMSTLALLMPLLACAVAILKTYSRQSAWVTITAALAFAYSAFAILGSGGEALLLGLVLFALGVPIYFLLRRRSGEGASG